MNTIAERMREAYSTMYSILRIAFLTRRIRSDFDNIYEQIKKYIMTLTIQNFQFQVYYSHKYKMYDFSVFDQNNILIYHYHFSNLKDINKLIQEFK